MRFFKSNKKINKDAKNGPRGFKVTDNVVRRYCKLRQGVEQGEIKALQIEYNRFESLGKKIKKAGYDLDQLYDDFKDDREFLSEEEREHLDVAEEIYEDKDEIKEEVRYVVVQKGVPFVKEREVDRTSYDGSIERIKETSIPVAVCGKKLSSETEVEGFCSVCDRGVCSDHLEYCAGYGTSRCGKLLCPDHVSHFTGSDGVSYPCCKVHFEMRINLDFQEPDPFKPSIGDKPSQSDG